MLHPDLREVLPLRPEPILQHDGTEKNDGESHAAKRFITTLRHDHPHLQCIVTADSLRANAPHIEALHDAGCHDILGVKEGDHAYVFKHVQAAEDAGAVTYYARHDRAAGVVHRFRFVNAMPLNALRADVHVNCIAYWEITPAQVQHCSWVTDLRVSTRASKLALCRCADFGLKMLMPSVRSGKSGVFNDHRLMPGLRMAFHFYCYKSF